ncbi:hypothetical protein Tco_0927376 [Tanacetum coccineum]
MQMVGESFPNPGVAAPRAWCIQPWWVLSCRAIIVNEVVIRDCDEFKWNLRLFVLSLLAYAFGWHCFRLLGPLKEHQMRVQVNGKDNVTNQTGRLYNLQLVRSALDNNCIVGARLAFADRSLMATYHDYPIRVTTEIVHYLMGGGGRRGPIMFRQREGTY